jgi:hypothetical protein
MLDRSSSHAHGLRHPLEPRLHGLYDVLVLPSTDAPFLTRGAVRFDGAGGTGIGPVFADGEAVLD